MAMHSREPYVGRHRKIYVNMMKGDKKVKPKNHLTLTSGD